jgi:hypothetical protein
MNTVNGILGAVVFGLQPKWCHKAAYLGESSAITTLWSVAWNLFEARKESSSAIAPTLNYRHSILQI